MIEPSNPYSKARGYYGRPAEYSEPLLSPDVDPVLPACITDINLLLPKGREIISYVLHLVLNRTTYSGDEDGFTPIHARQLASVVDRRFAHRVLHELLSGGLLETDGHHIKGEKSRGYRLTAHAKSLELVVIPASLGLSAKIQRLRQRLTEKANADSPVVAQLHRDLSRFTFGPGVGAMVEQLPPTESNLQLRLTFDAFTRRRFFITRGKTGRVYHSISGMSRRLRPLLLADNEPTCEIDVQSCQPLLLVLLYPEESLEKLRFCAALQGDFYSHLGMCLEQHGGLRLGREEIKQRWTRETFGKMRHRQLVFSALQREFPELCARIDQVQTPNYRELARQLQRAESRIMIEKVVPRVKELMGDIALSTVHDAIICPASRAHGVAQIMREKFTEAVGFEVVVKIKSGKTGESTEADANTPRN